MRLPEALLGLDFSCAPSARKPLTLARGRRAAAVVRLEGVDEVLSHEALATLIQPGSATWPGGFVMGCDFPFGLPRAFVEALRAHGPGDLPEQLRSLEAPAASASLDASTASPHMASQAECLIAALHRHCVDRAGFQRLVDGWGQAWHTDRHPGGKLLHRPTDQAAPGVSSTSPLQTRYVPVGKMYFEGMKRLVDADLSLPGLRTGRPDAIALEAYPGLLAHELLGRRSYKSDAKADAPAQQARLIARMDMVDALEQGRTRLGLRLKLSPAQRDHLVSDAKGDRLDAVLCLLQAAWAHAQREAGHTRWGLPDAIDPVEGWILSA